MRSKAEVDPARQLGPDRLCGRPLVKRSTTECLGFLGDPKNADVAELADARGSGPRDRKVVGVQVPPSALASIDPVRKSRVLSFCARFLAPLKKPGDSPGVGRN